MIPKGALIWFGAGVLVSMIVGFWLMDFGSMTNELKLENGPSILIQTEKNDFKIGEEIKIKIINSGTVPLSFPDSSYGLKIVGLDGTTIFSPSVNEMTSSLNPKEEKEFLWNQKKLDGSQIIEGRYKIVSVTELDGKTISNSLIINVIK